MIIRMTSTNSSPGKKARQTHHLSNSSSKALPRPISQFVRAFHFHCISALISFPATLSPDTTSDLCLRADAGKDDIMHAIKDAGAHITSICREVLTLNLAALGFIVPEDLCEERRLRITMTEGDSVYDAAVPGELRINRYIVDVLSIFSS